MRRAARIQGDNAPNGLKVDNFRAGGMLKFACPDLRARRIQTIAQILPEVMRAVTERVEIGQAILVAIDRFAIKQK
jgi:hypothetical protein